MAPHDVTTLERELAEQRLMLTRITATMDAQVAKTDRLYSELMDPQPGQDKGLLERMAGVTLDFEAGRRTGQNLASLAKWIVGIGAAVAALKVSGVWWK